MFTFAASDHVYRMYVGRILKYALYIELVTGTRALLI